MIDALFTGTALWFTLPAMVGTFVFAIKLFMLLVGIDSMEEGSIADTGMDDVGIDDAMTDGQETEAAFKMLSVQTVAAFAMGGGWAGLIGLETMGWGIGPSLLLALLGGAGMVWLLVKMFTLLFKLQASGNISIRDAVGREGRILVLVPASGSGKGRVRVVIDDVARRYDAVTGSAQPIPSNTSVRIVAANNAENTLTVSTASDA